jgi:single-stranded DNA-binding protein
MIECAFFAAVSRDAEYKVSKAGKPYLKLACRIGDADATTWVNAMAFVDNAQELAPKLVKGAAVYIEGTIRLDEWTAQDGTKRAGLSVFARRCEVPKIGRNKPKREPDRSSGNTSYGASANDFHNDEIGF